MLGFWNVAAATPDERGIVDANGVWTWGEFNARCNRLANALTALGLGRGDHIAVHMGNRAEFLEAYGAIFKTGRYLTGVNWHYTAREAAYVMRDCAAKAVIVDDAYADVGREAAAEAGIEHVFVTGREYEDLLAAHSPDEPADQEAGIWMPYTGGTTGHPKGVFRPLRGLTPDAAVEAGAFLGALLGLEEGGVHLVTGPLYHNAPMGFGSGALHRGETIVLMRRWDAADALATIERERVTTTHMVPTMFRRLIDLPADVRDAADTSSIRSVFHGAAPCPKWVKKAMIDWLGPVLVEYYGATEGGLTIVRSEEWLTKPGTVGKPIPIWEVLVRDDDGNVLGPNEQGVVWFRLLLPDTPTFSYFNDTEQTTDAYASDGTFTVGDIGYVDDDGFVFLVDRRKELIISGGVNIYPIEIEEILSEHPDVSDVCVFGIPNEEWGEEVKAAVVLQPGATSAPEDIIGWARDRMAHYKVPRTVDVLDALPRDETGKLFRRKLREPYWAGRASAISTERS